MISRYGAAAALALALVLALGAGAVSAHEERDAHGYALYVGFLVEPAFEGIKNGAFVSVTKPADDAGSGHGGGHAHGGGTAVGVEGVHETLKVEVTHVPTGKSVVLALRPVLGAPGEYVADLIPTAPGVYEFRFFGDIEGKPVDESFASVGGGGGFDDVRPASDLHFPEAVRSAREIEAGAAGALNMARAAEDEAVEARDAATTATTLAVVGIVVGAIGAAAGAAALAVAIRRG